MLNSDVSYDNAYSYDNVYGHALELLVHHRQERDASEQERIHLDIGCGYGRIAEPLTETLGIRYVGVDGDEAGLASLRERGMEAHQIFLGIEDEVLAALRGITGSRKIASITMLDTLEHLLDGDATLRAIAQLGREHGAVVVLSVPNVAHRDIGYKLAFGSWNYTDAGLLDHTHVRLFSHASFRATLEAAGLHPVDRLDVRHIDSDQHFPRSHPALSRATLLHQFLEQMRDGIDSTGDIIQFVVACVPGPRKARATYLTEREKTRPFLSIVTRTQGTRMQSLVEVFTCLAGQTSHDFEVIVVGHRLDLQRQIAVERAIEDNPTWLREKIRLLRVDKGNRTHPLNRGFQAAEGQYIAILDDDDIPMGHWVESFQALAQTHPGCLLRCVSVVQKVENVTVHNCVGVRAVGTLEKCYPSSFDLLEHLRGNQTPNTCIAFPRGVFHDLKIQFDESLTTTEDWDYILRTAMVADVASSPDISCIYHWWLKDQSSRTDHPQGEWQSNQNWIYHKIDYSTHLFPKGTTKRIREMLGELDSRQQRLQNIEQHAADLERQRLLQIEQHAADLERQRLLQIEQHAADLERQRLLQIEQHAAELNGQQHQLEEQDSQRMARLREVCHLLESRSWRLSSPLRFVGRLLGRQPPVRASGCLHMSSEQLGQLVQQIRASSSWKVTKPLRKLRGG